MTTNFQPSVPACIPSAQERTSGWSGVSQVPFLTPVSGMDFVNTAVSQIFPGTFPHVPSHLLGLVSSSPVLSQCSGYRCLKSQAQRMRRDQKTTQKHTHKPNQTKPKGSFTSFEPLIVGPLKFRTKQKRLGGGHSKPTAVFLPGEFHGQRSLAHCSPQGRTRAGHNGSNSEHTHAHMHESRLKGCERAGLTRIFGENVRHFSPV